MARLPASAGCDRGMCAGRCKPNRCVREPGADASCSLCQAEWSHW